MSGALTALGTALGAASLLFSSNRSIVGAGNGLDMNGNAVASISVIPNLAIAERHRDAMGVTSQPVERGAAITDHAFRLPAELELEYGWSNSSVQAIGSDFVDSTSLGSSLNNFGEGYVRQVYQTILALQQSRQLCTIVTGKRRYTNMLIAEASTETTADTAYSMFVRFRCIEIIIAQTRQTTVIVQENQAVPASTAPVVPMGTKALQQVPQTSSMANLRSLVGL